MDSGLGFGACAYLVDYGTGSWGLSALSWVDLGLLWGCCEGLP